MPGGMSSSTVLYSTNQTERAKGGVVIGYDRADLGKGLVSS